jgi:hypothetical protein
MVNPGAFKGLRKTFLLSNKAAYADAVASNTVAEFIVDLLRRFFKRFPPALPNDEEPSPDHLASVDDNTADPDILLPDEKLSKEAFEVAQREYKAIQGVITFRTQVTVFVVVDLC